MGTIRTLLDQHQAGTRDHSAALWSLSTIEAFLRQVHGQRTITGSAVASELASSG
jgi:asparagine synthase (glutamine-hydrolysing)